MSRLLALSILTLYITVVMIKSLDASESDQYLCVSEKSAGLFFSDKSQEWQGTTFQQEAKYIISKSKDGATAFKVVRMGEKHPLADCVNDFNEAGFLFCEGIDGNFKFNKINGRYLRAHTMGYYNVLPKINNITDNNSLTPFVEIGKCSPF